MDNSRSTSSFTIILSFLCIAFIGIALIPKLKIKLSPSETISQMTVKFNMLGSSAQIVERKATSKLEAMLVRIKGIKSIRSTSGNGWGEILIELDKHVNKEFVRLEASSIIKQIFPNLPENVSYPLIELNNLDSKPFIIYTLNADTPAIAIQEIAEDQIKPKLAQLPGIHSIDIYGATPKEWQLEYDIKQLHNLNIRLEDIILVLKQRYNQEFLGIGAATDLKNQKKWIRLALKSPFVNEQIDLSKINIISKDGVFVNLSKVLNVSQVTQPPQGYYRVNGLNAVYFSIKADKDANQLYLNKLIEKEIEKIKLNLPSKFRIDINYNATDYIWNELGKILKRTFLILITLSLFLIAIGKNFRYQVLILASLLVNTCIAIIFYYLLKLEIQLYSLAGLTISLGLVLDYIIVMTDHLLTRNNKNAYLSILAATLTVIGSLSMIFFFADKVPINLNDFAAVIIVNLCVSLFISLFFVPALINKLGLKKRQKNQSLRSLKRITRANHFYNRTLLFLVKWRGVIILILILTFGIPLFLLPERIEKSTKFAEFYNNIANSEKFQSRIRPTIEKVLGGTLRLFVQEVYEGSTFVNAEETILHIAASLPNGSTLEQMNSLIKEMEIFLKSFHEVKQFQTRILDSRQAVIDIYFHEESKKTNFPYLLKSNIVSKSLLLGGGSWAVWGLQDQGFTNDTREEAGSFQIEVFGYNYETLYDLSEKLKSIILLDRRVDEVTINSNFSIWKDDYHEFYLKVDQQSIAKVGLQPFQLFNSISEILGNDLKVGQVQVNDRMENIKMTSFQYKSYDIWNIMNIPQNIENKEYKLSDLAYLTKEQVPKNIVKLNQQYRLCLQYEFLGPIPLGLKNLEKILQEFNSSLPLGYFAKSDNLASKWGNQQQYQYLLLFIIIIIIFFLTGILFNSLKLPFSIILNIPISFMGVFLTFYWFNLNFDQGGFASFVLLCGIGVNSSIYILKEYKDIRREQSSINPVYAYIKAFNRKSIPIFLTIFSTILGFIPFLIGSFREPFWFTLAAGTIGGLIISTIAIILILPLFVLNKKN